MRTLGIALALFVAACDESSNAVKERTTSSSSSSSSTTGGPAEDAGKDCFDDPKTHFEIINACTNADRIDRRPNLPKLLSDGGLPPLE